MVQCCYSISLLVQFQYLTAFSVKESLTLKELRLIEQIQQQLDNPSLSEEDRNKLLTKLAILEHKRNRLNDPFIIVILMMILLAILILLN